MVIESCVQSNLFLFVRLSVRLFSSYVVRTHGCLESRRLTSQIYVHDNRVDARKDYAAARYITLSGEREQGWTTPMRRSSNLTRGIWGTGWR